MRVGLAFDLKDAISTAPGAPDDALEEYDSSETVLLIISSLEALGHDVVLLGGGREFLNKVRIEEGLDIVFNIAEGRGNYPAREAQVPAVLEMLGIPYTGSGPQCLAICLDKPLTKTLLKEAGIATPNWCVISSREELERFGWNTFRFPLVVKPTREGSSKGIYADSLVTTAEETKATALRLLDGYSQPVMVEQYISGEEVTVGMLGNSPPRLLGMMRIVPRNINNLFMYSLEVKRDYKNLVDYECPARLDEEVLKKIEEASLKTFAVLGCRDLSRLDFKVAADGTPYLLEINPLPGLGNHSDLVIMTQGLGFTHKQLLAAILEAALKRYPQCVSV